MKRSLRPGSRDGEAARFADEVFVMDGGKLML